MTEDEMVGWHQMTTGKTIALNRRTFVGKVMTLLFNMLSRLVSMKRQNDRILKEELPRSVGAQYATGDQWRNNSRKNEGMEPSKNNTQLWM